MERQLSLSKVGIQTKNSINPSRSCYACNSKKIRCDKGEPCSSCKRSGKPCSYPASGPRVRRSKKTVVAEMASRISILETALAKVKDEQRIGSFGARTNNAKTTAADRSATSASQTHLRKGSRRRQRDVIVQKGSSSQYFNEVLLSRILGEVSHGIINSNLMVYKK